MKTKTIPSAAIIPIGWWYLMQDITIDRPWKIIQNIFILIVQFIYSIQIVGKNVKLPKQNIKYSHYKYKYLIDIQENISYT